MEKISALVIYIITEVLLYIGIYTSVYGMKVTRKISRWMLLIVSTALISGSVYKYSSAYDAFGSTMLTMIIVPLLLIDGPFVKRILLYPFSAMFGGAAVVLCTYIMAICRNCDVNTIRENNWGNVCQLIPICVMYIYIVVCRIKGKKIHEFNLTWYQYIFVYVVTVSTLFVIGICQLLSNGELQTEVLSNRYSDISILDTLGLYASLSCLILNMAIIWNIKIAERDKELWSEKLVNDERVRNQKEYYEQLLAQDEELRRFKHDINSHIMTAGGMSSDDKFIGYVKEMIKHLPDMDDIRYTSNDDVNAILRGYMSE